MPKVAAVLVKPKSDKGHAGAGLAVLVPLEPNAAADPACDSACDYKDASGKPLLIRAMPRRQMENELRKAERLEFEGDKHRDVVEGKIPDARKEASSILARLKASFRTSLPDLSKTSGSAVVGAAAWGSEEARLAGTNAHKAVAIKALAACKASGSTSVEEYLRIASETKHEDVAFDAVELAVKAGATREHLLSACDRIRHEEAAALAFESAQPKSKE